MKLIAVIHSTTIKIILSPAYDLLNVNLIFPKDKDDMALTLGGRKRKIKQSDFNQLASSLGISDLVRNNIYNDFSKHADKIPHWIDRSFLTDEYKEQYAKVVTNKFNQIEL